MSKAPQFIGEVPRLVFRLDPPEDDPTAVATAVEVIVLHPDGTEDAPVPAVEQSTNVWLYEGDPIDEAGAWVWRFNATAGLVTSREKSAQIRPTPFTTPLP